MEQGQIILLNGTSSAGKTTIANALQEKLEAPYLHTGLDHFLTAVPKRLFVYLDQDAQAGVDGWSLPFHNGALIEAPRLGSVAYGLLDGMYASFAALAAAGINLILDDVIYDPQVLKTAVSRLAGTKLFFVGLHCPIEEAIRREQQRGDRAPGGAAIFHGLVHRHGLYDLEVDTAQQSPAEIVEQIRQGLLEQRAETAFTTLYKQLGLA